MFPFLVLNYMAEESNDLKQQNSTIKVNGYDIDRNEFIKQVNGQYDRFFNTYKDRWSKKQQSKILEQKKAILDNIQNGNITGVNGDVIDITNAENSGIDQTDLGPGKINIGYITKIGKWMSDGIKNSTPHKKFDSNTLNNAWMNTFFGGSDSPDLQSWIDLDEKGADGKRGTSGRTSAMIDFLNNLKLDDYTETSDELGGMDRVKANLETLKQHLADGVLNNNDYASAAKLGLNLRTIMSDNIVMPDTQETSDTEPQSTEPQSSATGVYDPFGTSPQNKLQEMKDMIAGWTYNNSDEIPTVQLKYTSNANFSGGAGHDVTGDTVAKILGSYGMFGKYKYNSSVDNSQVINNYITYVINNILNKGSWNTYKIKRADSSKISYGDLFGTALGLYVTSNKKALEETDKYTYNGNTLYMIGDADLKTGTAWFYNPNNRKLQKLNLRTPQLYFQTPNGPMSAAEYVILKSPYAQTYAQAHGIQQNRLGGKFQVGGMITPTDTDVYNINYVAQKPKITAAEQKKQQKENYWKGNEGKEFKNMSEFLNNLTPQDKREISAAALDVTSLISSLVPGAGGAVSVGTGLGSTGLRAYNRFNDGDITLGDVGATLADTGMALAGLIPGLGTAAKAGGFVYKMAKTARILLPVVGIAGIGSAAPGAYRALTNIIDGKMPSTTELQDLGTLFTAIAGGAAHATGSSRAKKTLQKVAADEKAVVSGGSPNTWTYKFRVKGKDGALQNKSISLNTKEDVDALKKAIKNDDTETILGFIKRDPNNAKVTSETLQYNKLNKLQKLKASDSDYGITFNKGNDGVVTLSSYTDPTETYQKVWNRQRAVADYLDKIRFPKPSWKGIKDFIIGPSQAEIIRDAAAANPRVAPEPTVAPEPIVSPELIVSPEPTVQPREQYIPPKIEVTSPTGQQPKGDAKPLGLPTRGQVLSGKLQKIFSNGQVNTAELKTFVNNNPNLLNKLSKKDRIFIQQLMSPHLGPIDITNKQVRKKTLGILTKMVTKTGGKNRKDKAETRKKISTAKNYFSNIKYQTGGILTYQDGGTAWYRNIQDYDPTKYQTSWENQIYAGDTNEGKTWSTAWGTSGNGLGDGRYGTDPNHSYTNSKEYAQAVENQEYYKWFTKQLINSAAGDQKLLKTFSDLVDKSLPTASKFYDANGNLKNSWTIGGKTYYGYDSTGNYNQIADYINAVRNDHLIANRHNVMRQIGTRYFYKDSEGKIHWVDPEVAKNYTIKKDPAAQGYNENDHTYWTDYEIIGPGSIQIQGQDVPKQENKIRDIVRSSTPAILGGLRAINDNSFNNGQLRYNLANLNPVIYNPYEFTRRVYGDYATMNEYNRQGAQAMLQANRVAANNADSYLGAATQLQGAAQNQDAVIKGRLADNQQIAHTYEKALAENKDNLKRETDIANTNKKNLEDNARERAALVLATRLKNHTNWNNWYQGYIEYPAAKRQKEREAMQNYLDYSIITEGAQNKYNKEAQAIRDKYYPLYTAATSDADKNKIYLEMSRDLENAKDVASNEILGKFAELRGLNYSPKVEFTPSGMYTPTPTYHKKGGEITGASVVVEHLRQRNKDKDRLEKSWEKQLDRFWRQYGKMKQANYKK